MVAAMINSAVREWAEVGSVAASSWELAAADVQRSHYVAPDTCVDVIVAIDPDGRMAPSVAPPSVKFDVMVPPGAPSHRRPLPSRPSSAAPAAQITGASRDRVQCPRCAHRARGEARGARVLETDLDRRGGAPRAR